MDFQGIVDSCDMAAAVLSVEKTNDGHYGEIRIVRANAKYKQIMGDAYYDNMIYSELIPKEPNFEDFCYRCAVLKQHLHAYIDTRALDVWTDGNYIPLSSDCDEGNLCHYLFMFEFTKKPDTEKLADVSIDIATSVIQTCITLRGSDNFYESMNTVIKDIRKKTECFSSCIIMIDKEQNKYAPLCVSYAKEGVSFEDYMPYLTPDVVFSWEETIGKHDSLIIKDEFDMNELEKVNPVWVKSLRGAGVKSLVLSPLRHMNKFYGVLFITDFNVDRIIELKEFIKLTAIFLSSEIANNDLMERLEYMSNVDVLTGVRNRNSMNARVDWHVNGKFPVRTPFGIVFADLNGLKQCNDSGGHSAGDELLKNAALLLRKHFGEYEIFRAGGDEFVVILPNCKKETLDNKVQELKAESEYGADVCFAVGSDWSENKDDLRLCMHNADENMYADKSKYYEKHPETKRR